MADDQITYLSWNGDSANGIDPHRPSIAQCGDNDKVDKPGHPVSPIYGISAPALNQRSWQIAAQAKVAAAAIVSVEFTGSTPIVVKATGPADAIAPIIFTVTDNGLGDTTIAWPVSTLVPLLRNAMVSINGDTPGCAAIAESTNQVRVRTTDHAGNAVDLPFTFSVG